MIGSTAPQPAPTSLPLPASPSSASGALSLIRRDGELPAALDAQMQRLYANIHSTFAHLGIYGGFEDITHVYLARGANERPAAILLLQRDGGVVRVINEGMAIDALQLQCFADHVFARWRSVHAISLHAVLMPDLLQLSRPVQQYPCTADVVVTLPESADQYVEGLGKNMRRNLKRYMAKLQSRFPTVAHAFHDGSAATDMLVRELIALNRVRIAGKNLSFNIDEAETERIVALVRERGMVSVMRVDGRIVAGGVGYRAGDAFFLKIIAHDPAFNDYSPGILICYLTICECIARGCREFNFMRSEYEYKFALGARTRLLDHVVVYRSKLHVLMNARLAVTHAVTRTWHRLSSLLEKAAKAQELTPAERAVVRVMEAARAVKRAVARRSWRGA